jgi:aspartate-semialdehyde dehydrogenase
MYAIPSDIGATGTVGQRFIALIESHPYFVVHVVGASARSTGISYYAVGINWKRDTHRRT